MASGKEGDQSGGKAEKTPPQQQTEKKQVAVLDGRDIEKLVGDKDAFGSYVEHKFQELDLDSDGRLSVRELLPAVADIGAAIGLPAQGSDPDSDHIYAEVLNEFTHGKQGEVTKAEFKEAGRKGTKRS